MWVRKTVVIKNKQGLHARPAAVFVRLASKFESEIVVRKGKEEVNGKSIMGILMLGCEKGSKVEISARGEDAERAMRELSDLLGKGLVELEKEK
ncbi:MAG: HPr family phosphocarrier protein [Candidatus Omnitrophica bacterium]|nr:HPr family phosphocarrier protein [Candidatus Omnitrophota bacterium]